MLVVITSISEHVLRGTCVARAFSEASFTCFIHSHKINLLILLIARCRGRRREEEEKRKREEADAWGEVMSRWQRTFFVLGRSERLLPAFSEQQKVCKKFVLRRRAGNEESRKKGRGERRLKELSRSELKGSGVGVRENGHSLTFL